MIRFTAVLMMFSLTACAAKVEPVDYSALYQHEPWANQSSQTWGLAVSGGGQKTAPFAMGVFKRLVDEGTIQKFDVVSSVSGGGYAALYLYTRANYVARLCTEEKNQAKKNRTLSDENQIFDMRLCVGEKLKDFYKDYRFSQISCLKYTRNGRDYNECEGVKDTGPSKFFVAASPDMEKYVSNAFVVHNDWEPEADHLPQCADQQYFFKQFAKTGAKDFRPPNSHYRSLIWSLCYPDLIGLGPGSFYTDRTGMGLSDDLRDYSGFLAAGLAKPLTLPLHVATHWAFDTPLKTSPSFHLQKNGLKRAYGHIPSELFSEEDTSFNLGPLWEKRARNFNYKVDLSFADLARLSQKGAHHASMPIWVVNATHPTSGTLDFRYLDLTRMDETRFEMSPYGYGSPTYGFVMEKPDFDATEGVVERDLGLGPIDAQLAAQAFLYNRQRIFSYPLNAGIQGVTELFDLDWSVSIPNYTMDKKKRTLMSWLPFPLHLVSRFDEPGLRHHIPLGDGGVNRDNFGLLPLLRRGIDNIVILDQSEDIIGESQKDHVAVGLQNLCEANAFLSSMGLTIEFDELPHAHAMDLSSGPWRLSKLCTYEDSTPQVRNPPNAKIWEHRHIHAKIIALNAQAQSHRLVGTKIYWVKSALNHEDLRACWVNKQTNLDSRKKLPATLCNWFYRNNFLAGFTMFPQHTVVAATGNNSPNLSAAYMDLGWYNAGEISGLLDEVLINGRQRR